MEPAEMVAKLGSRAGRWHGLAKLLQPLYQSGYDAKSLDELTGITPVVQVRRAPAGSWDGADCEDVRAGQWGGWMAGLRLEDGLVTVRCRVAAACASCAPPHPRHACCALRAQNRWIVAGTVYDSLVASGSVPEDVLRVFDGQGDELLYPFRFLTQVGPAARCGRPCAVWCVLVRLLALRLRSVLVHCGWAGGRACGRRQASCAGYGYWVVCVWGGGGGGGSVRAAVRHRPSSHSAAWRALRLLCEVDTSCVRACTTAGHARGGGSVPGGATL
jgi:hypothetical protein